MSFIFGKKKKEAAPTTSDAIGKLRETEELLTKKQEFLEKQISDQIGIARKKAGKDKRGKSTFNVLSYRFASNFRHDKPQ